MATPDGDAVIPAAGRHARVYPWVDLGSVPQPPASVHVAAEAGRLLGILHALAIPAEGPVDPWYTMVPSPEVWSTLTAQAGRAGAAWAAPLAAAKALIEELSAQVVPAPQRPLVTCHRDFTPTNVIPAAAGAHLIVLDWENAGPLDTERELGYVLLAWTAADGQFATGAAEAMLARYSATVGRDDRLEPGMFATAIAPQLNFLRVMTEQALADPAHRNYAEEQITSLLDHDLNNLRCSIQRASAALELS